MAAKLQCEICGGKLIGKPGGIFECENCGTEYSTEWAKAKIQEITGTVKVEGTVEVTGKVQVEGAANATSFLRRGELALEDGNWDDAAEYFKKVLDIEPENANAYLGKLLAKKHYTSIKELKTAKTPFETNPDYQKALRFADGTLKKQLQNAVDAYKRHQEKIKTREDERKKKERLEKKERIEKLAAFRKKNRIPNHMIAVGYSHTVGLKSDGTVVAVGFNYDKQCDVSDWTDIVAVAAGSSHSVGLKADGTVVATGKNSFGQCDVSDWTEIVAIEAKGGCTIGVRADGTVVAVGQNVGDECNTDGWTAIEYVIAQNSSYLSDCIIMGRRSNGTWVSTKNRWHFSYDEFKRAIFSSQDIVSIALGSDWTVLLKSDGSIMWDGEGIRYHGLYILKDLQDSQGFATVAGGKDYCVALRPNGKVVAAGEKKYGQCNVSAWNNIIAVAAGDEHTVGIKADGTVVAVGRNTSGQCEGGDWKLFNSVETIESERGAARKAAAEKADALRRSKIEALNIEKDEKEASKTALERELTTLTGIFKAGKRKEAEAELAKIEARLAKIEAELKKLG